MQADCPAALPFPGQELYSVGSDALVTMAEPSRQIVPGLNAGELFLDYQKIVSASMRLHKRDHWSSAS